MNINEIYETVQNNLKLDDINGELILYNDNIVWSYNLYDEEIGDDLNYDDDDENYLFNFDYISPEEKMLETYHHDLEVIKRMLDDYDINNWKFTEPKIFENSISFQII